MCCACMLSTTTSAASHASARAACARAEASWIWARTSSGARRRGDLRRVALVQDVLLQAARVFRARRRPEGALPSPFVLCALWDVTARRERERLGRRCGRRRRCRRARGARIGSWAFHELRGPASTREFGRHGGAPAGPPRSLSGSAKWVTTHLPAAGTKCARCTPPRRYRRTARAATLLPSPFPPLPFYLLFSHAGTAGAPRPAARPHHRPLPRRGRAAPTLSSGTDWQRRWRRAPRMSSRRGGAARLRVERRSVVATAAAAAAGAAAIYCSRRSRNHRRLAVESISTLVPPSASSHPTMRATQPRRPPRRRRRRPCSLHAVNCAASRELVGLVGMMEDATRTLFQCWYVRAYARACARVRVPQRKPRERRARRLVGAPSSLGSLCEARQHGLACLLPRSLPNPPPRRDEDDMAQLLSQLEDESRRPLLTRVALLPLLRACLRDAAAGGLLRSTCRSRSCTPWRRASTWTARCVMW